MVSLYQAWALPYMKCFEGSKQLTRTLQNQQVALVFRKVGACIKIFLQSNEIAIWNGGCRFEADLNPTNEHACTCHRPNHFSSPPEPTSRTCPIKCDTVPTGKEHDFPAHSRGFGLQKTQTFPKMGCRWVGKQRGPRARRNQSRPQVSRYWHQVVKLYHVGSRPRSIQLKTCKGVRATRYALDSSGNTARLARYQSWTMPYLKVLVPQIQATRSLVATLLWWIKYSARAFAPSKRASKTLKDLIASSKTQCNLHASGSPHFGLRGYFYETLHFQIESQNLYQTNPQDKEIGIAILKHNNLQKMVPCEDIIFSLVDGKRTNAFKRLDPLAQVMHPHEEEVKALRQGAGGFSF